MSNLAHYFLQAARPIALPIAVYPGIELTGAKVRDVVTNAPAQVAATLALHHKFQTPALLTAMDLSVEAEAFGCEIHMADDEIPTAVGTLITNMEQAQALAVPSPGQLRTRVYLEAAATLHHETARPPLLAGMIGPFSLAGRLTGLSEACGLTLMEPELMHLLLQKSSQFLAAYARAFKNAGADGIIMAEPAAGLLSPKGMAEFSSAYVRQILEAVEDDRFTVILHNCAAKLLHWPAWKEAGARIYHFGAPMDVPALLAQAPEDTVICGNLDPSAMFCQATPAEITARAQALMQAAAGRKNFVLSSGCDIPPGASLENLAAFFAAAR